MMNVNVNVKCHDSNVVVPYYLIFLQNDFRSLTPIHVPTE